MFRAIFTQTIVAIVPIKWKNSNATCTLTLCADNWFADHNE